MNDFQLETDVSNLLSKRYDLQLKKIFPTDSLFGRRLMPNLGINGMGTEYGTIYIDNKSHNSIYKATNLKGLCLQE